MTDQAMLTAHFSFVEMGIANVPIKEHLIIGAARCLCVELLEPIRQHFNRPVRITSGRRSPEHNADVGGKPDSWHVYREGKAAADFDIPGIPIEEVFDWIRLKSALKFDKVILEFSKMGGGIQPIANIVHIQLDLYHTPRRLAYTGLTGNSSYYSKVEVV